MRKATGQKAEGRRLVSPLLGKWVRPAAEGHFKWQMANGKFQMGGSSSS
jgi:hypothetical protein